MSEPLPHLEPAVPAPTAASSSGPLPTAGLTTFPNPYADETEPGLIPTLLSKVKSTFTSAISTSNHQASNSTGKSVDKGSEHVEGIPAQAQTEAQQIAEAAKYRGHGRRQSGPVPIPIPTPVPPILQNDGASSIRPSLTTPIASSSSLSRPSSQTQDPTKRLIAPGNRQWRPSGAAPAQVTVSPVTSVTTTVQTSKGSEISGSKGPPKPNHRAHFGLQAAVASSSRIPYYHHAHSNSLGGRRPRRSSLAAIPDSPSSVSLSAMIAANAELSQIVSHIPGFPLPSDDTRSIRSLGSVKKTNSVSRIIRRMRGEGLSKHYWMADEHCRECYDCKSIFTAWRRKHHCRICGQIFCSRCASNIIGARRFGQEGAVRVCNLCLKIMEEYKDDAEDDRRSINSASTNFRLPGISDRAFMDAAVSPDMLYAKSPFAASQLFSSNPNESLSAIDESSVPTRWGVPSEADLSRPVTPNASGTPEGEDDHIWTMRVPKTAAPFRRPMDEDAKDGDAQSGHEDSASESTSPAPASPHQKSEAHSPAESSQANKRRPSRATFPRSDTSSTDGGLGIRVPLSRVDSNVPLIGLRTRLSSKASQGGLTALLDPEKSEGLWRARSHSLVQRPEILAGASLRHFEVMLGQAIQKSGLPNPAEWHQVLSKLLLKVSTNLHPNVRAGDSIDVRAFVKIKKVPGGRISDSEYVDGIVISKNVTHKAMPRRLVSPRIMVVTFPLDYHRVERQFMSLDPILAQEKDYLRLLTRRIIDVRPHIVLVERAASRIALDYLREANIAVARNVKVSAIRQVARCTQADVVASMDRLALEPRLGRCAEFQIQSFEHDLIPGRRKTLMRFEGCHRDYGCTIILRGGDLETLRKVKVVADFMALVVYHLKSEIILYCDEHNILPPRPPLPLEYQDLLDTLTTSPQSQHDRTDSATVDEKSDISELESPALRTPTANGDDGVHAERHQAFVLTRDIAQSLEPYLTLALSASAAIRFPPPATLAKMAMLDRSLNALQHSRDEEEAAQILHEENISPDTARNATINSGTAISTSTPVRDASETVSSGIASSTAMSAAPTVAVPPRDVVRDPYRVLRKPEEIARESKLAQVEHEHSEQVKLWQWYTKRHVNILRPEDFQGIVYVYSLGCEGCEKPCVEPRSQHINFYQPDDLTIGQYLEGLASDAVKRCPSKACDRLLLFHFRLLAHGDRRLQIAMDQFSCPSPGHEDQIITWSYCRLCATPSPTTIMRDETWEMSWGTYLEHCFYPPETSAGFACPHDAYRDQIRYFAHLNLAIRIHNESIDLFEPVRPSITLQVKPETKVVLKNQEYESALQKNTAFFDSVLFRLRSFDYELVQPEMVTALRTALGSMLSQAVSDREEMVNLLNRTYKLTPMTDVLALNTVLRTLQDKVVQWDSDFVDIEKVFMPSEKDLRRMTATHLKRLFANQDVFNSLDRSVAGLAVSEADEKEIKSADSETTSMASEPPTPALHSTDTPHQMQPSQLDLPTAEDDGLTPIARVLELAKNPLSEPPTPRDVDSDSTIGAPRRKHHGGSTEVMTDRVESSGMDSDVHGEFVSRLPRRSLPAPSIADLVQRFQESAGGQSSEHEVEVPVERPRSSASARRLTHRVHELDGSDSNKSHKPRLRRGRTEQPTVRNREGSKASQLSDGDRSYAANASRIPSTFGKRSLAGPSEYSRPSSRSRTVPQAPTPPSRSGRASPDPTSRLTAPGPSKPSAVPAGDPKRRVNGKGRTSRQSDLASGRASPGLLKTATRRTLGGSNRVNSIARHFDRLSREAERERQKRISMVRGKRARPVGVTKAKVQVFSDLRDAFRDESDSDSSEADDEEDDQGSEDSADSAGQRKAPRKSRSPVKSQKSLPAKQDAASRAVPMTAAASSNTISSSVTDEMPISASASSIAGTSVLSDARSEMSFTDRLQIELPSFETSAPLPSVPVAPQLSNDKADEAQPALSRVSHMSESELSSGGERSSIIKTLTGLWAFRAGDFTPLEYPLSAAEHIFADSRVIIRENEPTSIVAFALSSKTYRDKMRNVAFHSKSNGKVEAFMPEDTGSNDRASTWDIVSLDEAVETDDPSRREGGTHLKYDFKSGSSTIFCRIFFAEQFAALRSVCQCEDSFVESLARCVQFDAAGGKSGSAFLKSKDDRFIAKEISRLEMDALTKFAPAYFEYTRKAFQGQRPTVLAKIYGFFKIGYRNAITGRALRMNVLVMENLFYERSFSKIYDLKGSTRNRLIQATGRVNEVLLDENLMEIVYKHPLYLREHSKRILRTALFNDTLFLSNLNVMDYSLVVGVDSEKHELVVGIVDYIRTFTWDKKLESWVKDSAFLGGAGKGEPTIVTPKQYKTRFRTAMERFYFPSVPDRWTKINADEPPVDEEAITTT